MQHSPVPLSACSSTVPQFNLRDLLPQTCPHGPLPSGRSSEAEMQWRLQVNRLQELIDQLECKVSGHVAIAPWEWTFLESAQARHMLGPSPHSVSLTGPPAGTPT